MGVVSLRKQFGGRAIVPLIVGALMAAALGVRLAGVHQDLLGDELFTFDDVHGRDLTGVLQRVRDGYEDNPPLFFILAWAAAKLGDTTVWIRLPSVLLGTALVPVTFLLGKRTVGRVAAVAASAIVALSPFAIFYGTEARAYASLMFLSALSTLALVRASDSDRWGWYVGYGACVCAVLYTHYTAVFVVLAQATWAVWHHRDRIRPIGLALAGAVVAYSPWLVTELTKDPTYTKLPALSPRYFLTSVGQVLPGQPLVSLRSLPGSFATALFAGAVLFGVLTAAKLLTSQSAIRPAPDRRMLSLLVLTGLAAPAGMVLSSLGEHNILLPRGLSGSFPAICLLIGWAVTARAALTTIILSVVVCLVLAVGATKAINNPVRGTEFRTAAQWIRAHADSRDAVVYTALNHQPPHPLAAFVSAYLPNDKLSTWATDFNDRPAWRGAAAGNNRVFLVLPSIMVFGRPLELRQRAGPGRCFRLGSRRTVSGSPPVLVGVYSLPLGERLCARMAMSNESLVNTGIRLRSTTRGRIIKPWFGRHLPVAPNAARGAVDRIHWNRRQLIIDGALPDTSGARAAAWILAFHNGRLLAAGVPGTDRPEITAQRRLTAGESPFNVRARARTGEALSTTGSLEIFVVAGNRAFTLRRVRRPGGL